MVDFSQSIEEVGSRAKVFYYLIGSEWSTAQETASDLNFSRSQADRLLRNLYQIGIAERQQRQTGSPGRPEYEYRIKPPFRP